MVEGDEGLLAMLKDKEPGGVDQSRQRRAPPGAVASVSAKQPLLSKFWWLYLLTTPTVNTLMRNTTTSLLDYYSGLLPVSTLNAPYS